MSKMPKILLTLFSSFLFAASVQAADVQTSEAKTPGKIFFGGDVTLVHRVQPDQKTFFTDRTRSYIENGDLFIWNCEFSGDSKNKKEKRFVFSAPFSVEGMAFKNGVAQVANNHALDGNQEGFDNLLKELTKYKIPASGVKHPVPEKNYLVYENNGHRYYILSTSPMISGNATSNWNDIIQSVKAIKKEPGDRIIVNIHEGVEGTTQISDAQRKHAKQLADLGVDIVSFTHSHTYIDPGYIGNTLVIWGLGNFIFGGNYAWMNRDDVRMVEVDPETLKWRWLRGKNANYVFDLNDEYLPSAEKAPEAAENKAENQKSE